MKNVLISLLALAAVSGAALASDRGYNERELNAHFSKFSTQHKMESSAVNSNALATVNTGKANVTAFERMTLTSEDNENSSK